jgi:hypothetical protein
LTVNARFDADIAGWVEETGMLARWNGQADGLGSASSGSIAITNPNVVAGVFGLTSGALSQCDCVVGGGQYEVGGQVYLAGAATSVTARIELVFYPTTDCSGAPAATYSTSGISLPDAWLTPRGATSAPAAAQSALVRLVVEKTLSQGAAEVEFDNILLMQR